MNNNERPGRKRPEEHSLSRERDRARAAFLNCRFFRSGTAESKKKKNLPRGKCYFMFDNMYNRSRGPRVVMAGADSQGCDVTYNAL